MTTFSAVLSDQLRRDAGRPLVTYYDHAPGGSGERTELSVTTYANWVAKASSLLIDELGLDRGARLRVDLPPHWMSWVFLGAAWNAGLCLTDDDAPDVVLCGPDTLPAWAAHVSGTLVLAGALLPFGVRFPDGVPDGVHDVGVEIWAQPDAFIPWDPAVDDDAAVDLAGLRLTQAQMWEAAATGTLVAEGGRLLSAANPASPPGIATFTEPLLRGGSVVLVAGAGPEQLEATAVAERVTARFGA